MSGRWRGPESPPHSPPTAELERGRGERRGLRPAPQAPEPPRSLALRSPFPVRIPELGTQPALAHRQPDGGAAALGETRARPGPSAPASRALGSSVPTSPRAQPPPPALSVLRPPAAPQLPAPGKQLPSPGGSFTSPSPKVRGSPTPSGPQACRGGGDLRREHGAERDRAPRRGAAARRERAPAPCASSFRSLGTNARVPTRALPFTWHGRRLSGDVRSGLLRGGRPGHIAANPAGRQVSRCVPSPPLAMCPRPPPPYPLYQKCHSFSAFGSFAKSPRGLQELGCNARRANPADALPRPPAAPCARPVRGEKPPRRGHRPRSAARGPPPLPRAFPSPSGCRLSVPRVLIPLLMNILTEANAVEVN